jgi:hypothetical protein
VLADYSVAADREHRTPSPYTEPTLRPLGHMLLVVARRT